DIHVGDIIQSIGSRKILAQDDFNTAMSNISAGETLNIGVWRDGKTKMYDVRTTAFPEKLALDLAYDILGIKVKNLSKKNLYTYKIYTREGVMISELNPHSYLARIGAEPGEVIRQIDEFTIKNTKDFKKSIVKYRKIKSLVIVLQRKDQIYNISVRL
ncbi:MAG: PDZ domain-containing protein, partial [Desulfobacterales bacterium]